MTDARRALPSVSALLDSDAIRPLLDHAPRALVTDAVRAAIDAVRRAPDRTPPTPAAWADAVRDQLSARERHSLRPAFNATGVVLHTNLGRAPIADAAIEAIARTAAGYATLEYDVERGERGSRHVHCRELLRELTGADDALVVNNCAAALVLALNTLAEGREVIVSRGELIEIGGSFRIPEIMERSGARLVEVGTTNRTHPADYERALGPDTGALVKVHRSNFVVQGYAAEVPLIELVALARQASLPLIHDFGSGLLLSLEQLGLGGEPTATDIVAARPTLAVMSGDKLLGGPQAGIILGERDAIARLARNPLTRALRVDKLTIAALQATLALYRDQPRALLEIPILAMIGAPVATLRSRAERIAQVVRSAGIEASIVATEASVGGGAFPAARIPSLAVALGGDAVALERAARLGEPPIIGRIGDGRFLLDVRTILPRDEPSFIAALERAIH